MIESREIDPKNRTPLPKELNLKKLSKKMDEKSTITPSKPKRIIPLNAANL